MAASRSGDVRSVGLRLLSGRCRDLEARDSQGWEALIHAASLGSLAAVKHLLELAGHTGARTDTGADALVAALSSRHIDVAHALLASHMPWYWDLEARDKHGRTAPQHAAWRDQHTVVRPLLRAGADPTARSGRGWSVGEVTHGSSIHPDGAIGSRRGPRRPHGQPAVAQVRAQARGRVALCHGPSASWPGPAAVALPNA